MFSLSKKTEYGLLALIHLSELDYGQLANVSEIAQSTAIPKELLAKILSELVRADLAISLSGPNGGFRLARPASSVSLADILRVLETRTGLIECLSKGGKCAKKADCVIKSPMSGLNHKFRKILEETKLADFIPPGRRGGIPLPMASSLTGENS